jgi:hypothetical protein
MASPEVAVAKKLAHAKLSRNDQVIGLIWSLYPNEGHFGEIIDVLEAAGLSSQNRTRLRAAMKTSPLVSKGKGRDSLRVNPKYVAELNEKFGQIVGAPTKIVVDDATALIPIGTLPLTRKYLSEIVRQANEGYIAEHFDSVAVMLRRLIESLLIESYVHAKREAQIKSNGNFVMLERLIAIFDADAAFNKSRNLVRRLRQIKEVGDTAAHDRNYLTKKADIEHIKLESRRCVSELAALAGL